MKRKINIGLLFIMLFQLEISYSQQPCISAGDVTLSHYTDLVPDVKVNLNSSPIKYDLDINGDHIYDFTVSTWSYYGSGGHQWHAMIEGIGKNRVLANSVNIDLPDTLTQGAFVCDSAVWRFAGYFYDNWNSSINDHWANLSNRYVGLKIKNDVDSTLGWVQIYSDGTDITIKDFGCGMFPLQSDFLGFPNPTDDYINIYIPNYTYYELKLYNDRGDIVYDNFGNEKRIDVEHLSSGIYFLRLITDDKIFNQKIIVKRKGSN